ncbi:MAG: GNAT family N-acetyltransferase, partial [Flavobacteriaceae bacterium]|nr:GNAT family N-acetyltransferase [Flavobacteriaceae bacterium]
TKFKDFDVFKTKHLPSKVNQYAKKLKRDTNYSIHITSENLVEEIAQIHIDEKNHLQSHGNLKRHSIFEDALKKKFIEKLMKNKLVLSYFLQDNKQDKIITYRTGIIFNNRYYSFNTAYQPEYKDYRVGKILILEILRENFINPLWDAFDAGCGRYPWKFEWTSDFNLLYQLRYIKPESSKLKLLAKYSNIRMALAK